jgi:hypothetical protein
MRWRPKAMPDEAQVAVPEMTPEGSEVSTATVVPVPEFVPRPRAQEAWDPVSPEAFRQLEARARARMADPEYQRRIEATDALARSILDGER